MRGNSRIPFSAQTGVHEQLPALLERHRQAPFRKPTADYNRAAYETCMARRLRLAPGLPLILDACCGTGESSLALARLFPDHYVIGVDQSAARLRRRSEPGVRETLPENVDFARADLVDFWRLLHDDGVRLSRHYLLYPNPWPKIGHLSRRWHGHAVFPAVLALGGVLECRSNWRIYVEEFCVAVNRLTGLPVQCLPWLPESPLTPFERKYIESGHALYRMAVDLGAAVGEILSERSEAG